MNLEKYKKYRRIYPKPRLSWSLYLKYIRKDWYGVYSYLLGIKDFSGAKQMQGTQVHELVEKEGVQIIKGIERVDFGQGPVFQEKKLIKEYEGFDIIGVPDMYNAFNVWDIKTGKLTGYEQQLQLYMWMIGEECTNGYLLGVKTIFEGEDIKEVRLDKVFQYQRMKDMSIWEERFHTMYQEILLNIEKGALDKFINIIDF